MHSAHQGFPSAPAARIHPQCRSYRSCRFNPWVGKIPWRRVWQPTPVFLLGESHGLGSLLGYSPWGHRESDKNELTVHACTHSALCCTYVSSTSKAYGKQELCLGGHSTQCLCGNKKFLSNLHEWTKGAGISLHRILMASQNTHI